MKKSKTFGQTIDILVKIFSSFIIVFFFYFLGKFVNNFAYNYFVFPLVAIVIVFVCGVNVGRSLEKMKTNEKIGFFTRENKKIKDDRKETEFIVSDTNRIVKNKKILKEVSEGDKIHIKVFNYNDLFDERERE